MLWGKSYLGPLDNLSFLFSHFLIKNFIETIISFLGFHFMFGIVCSSYLFLNEEFALGRVYDPSWYSYLLNANLWNSSTVKHSQEIDVMVK